MLYIQRYRSPLGEILMAADDAGLVGLWFAGQKHFAPGLTQAQEQETPVLAAAGRWLDLYFAGRRPHFIPPLHLTGTEFRMAVWSLLQEIPYGEVTTYGELARQLAQRLEVPHMSAQAVGGAVSAGSSVDVYATGSAATQALARGVSVLATSAGTDDRPASGSASKVTWVTLAIDPNQVEELVSAAQKTELYLTLPGADAR